MANKFITKQYWFKMNKTLNVASDFCKTPGGRYKTDGPYSGELFREKLIDLINDKSIDKIIVNFDGLETSGSSFLEEAFGGLIRQGISRETIKNKLFFECDDDLTIIPLINQYIEEALI